MRHALASLLLMTLPGDAASAQEMPAPAAAPVQAAPELRRRADELVGLLNGSVAYDRYFAPSFREAIPQASIDGLNKQLRDAFGKAVKVERLTASATHMASFRLELERGFADGQIAIDAAAPHQVVGLRITATEPRVAAEQSLEAVAQAIRTLPGTTGFTLTALDGAVPTALAAHNARQPLAIGSAFKLVILAELVRATKAGERKWDDPVTLDGGPLPSGGYTQKPKGTQVSLRELATQMISVSDNSATDLLLHHLGRTKVEAMLPVVGLRDGAGRNLPFLSTLDMFKIKGVEKGALVKRWVAADTAGRRALLAGPIGEAPMSAIPTDLFQDNVPLYIDTIEWFASADDLVRVMDWLRRNTEGPAGAEARAVLSKNPGIGSAAEAWQWVAYKGGSEPGVLNMTLLLQARDGRWMALAASWNNPAAAVDTLRFQALVNRAVALAAAR